MEQENISVKGKEADSTSDVSREPTQSTKPRRIHAFTEMTFEAKDFLYEDMPWVLEKLPPHKDVSSDPVSKPLTKKSGTTSTEKGEPKFWGVENNNNKITSVKLESENSPANSFIDTSEILLHTDVFESTTRAHKTEKVSSKNSTKKHLTHDGEVKSMISENEKLADVVNSNNSQDPPSTDSDNMREVERDENEASGCVEA